jgi:ABC-type bacteriocin/lantibiotic exporter with double-glycine peptidase domain
MSKNSPAIKLKAIRQSSGFCGPATLSSLLDFYGVKMSERQLGDLCRTTTHSGTEPQMLVQVLNDLGFKTVAKTNGTWAELKSIVTRGTPVLINWWSDFEKPADGHYSLVYKVTDKLIFFMDPELGGFRRMGKERFMEQWYDFYLDGRKNNRWFLYIKE